MNLIESIRSNKLLKTLYPKGINTISINGLGWNFSRLYLDIRTQETPNVFIDKYGEWKKDYDTIEFHLIGNLVSYMRVQGWSSYHKEECDFKIQKDGDEIFLQFWKDEKWSIEIKLDHLVFQSCITYLKSENDYIVP